MLLCLTIPQYPLAVALGGRTTGNDAPIIVADRFDRGHVVALDERAIEYGARIGQTVTQAVAAASHARVAVYDTVRGCELWREMLDALDAVTPLVDDARPGLAFLDMHGIPGDASKWMNDVRSVVANFQMPVRLGYGPSKFCAYAAAWSGDGTTIEPGEESSAVAALPLELLDLDAKILERLHLLGLKTLGDLAQLPHGPFVRRFGREAAAWHERARGVDRTPFVPRGHAVTIEASIFGEGQADDEAQVVFAMRMLLARVSSDLQRCGKRAGLLQLEIELDNGDVRTVEVPLVAATADERAMLDVMRAKLEGMTFPAPIVGLHVRAMNVEGGGEHLTLFAGDDIDRHGVAVTLARLEAALGEPVLRARTQAAHALEHRFCYERFSLPAREPAHVSPLVTQTIPQLRLLAVREVDVRVRSGEPSTVGQQTVLECAGPWRIDEGWFGERVSRDEYDVLLEDGEMCRIYRQGERWYLRGAYD